jgi:hypothetical protein
MTPSRFRSTPFLCATALALLSLALPPAMAQTPDTAEPSPGDTPTFDLLDDNFVISRGFLTLGTARFTLNPLGEDCYRYAYAAKPQGLARLFIGEVTEVSELCVVDGYLQPRMYSFSREDTPEDNYVMHFDHAAGMARTDDGVEVSFDGRVYDRLSLQLAVQQWVIGNEGAVTDETLTVTQIEPDRQRDYSFQVTRRETLEIRGRPTETVRVDRVGSSKRSVRVWVAPADGWRIVRVEHIDGDSTQFGMQLE